MLQGKVRWIAMSVVVLAMVLVLGSVCQAQDNGAQGGIRLRQGQGPGQGQNAANPQDRMAQFRERMTQRVKDSLGVTDEEWAVLQPKIEKVMTLQRDASGGRMMGMMRGVGGGRNRQGQGGQGQVDAAPATPPVDQSPVAKAATNLQTVADNKDAKPEDVKAALDAYRAAQAKAAEELQAARKDLKDVLTVQQEAKLVLTGILE